MTLLRVNLGSGPDYRDGYVNVDVDASHGPDVVADAVDYLCGLEPRSVGEIIAYDLLEHLLDPLSLMREAHRVLETGGVIKVRVPHYKSDTSWLDWSHIHKDWRPAKMRWLTNPSDWVGFRYDIVELGVERPHGFINRVLGLGYGQILATYQKPGGSP